ncbi:hypothetical protein LEP1GSC116_4517 [Leptospira interrogans serovar Icterohaemorrhagiae str. Verdun HP]|uniref:Uncharacterized protein n=1 Tax=Leptospira interrogans serovar Icterohaemorrhagiae str. Verdun HP TaxID=1049910 RepID=M6RFI0_LEPIR|nr:hypothetical protein LEP1GSC116_4517 [Leptospira interrogans serovar Icterohaemorrhagiae str. Verdun HP]
MQDIGFWWFRHFRNRFVKFRFRLFWKMNFLSCACSILESTNKKILPIPFIKNVGKLIFKQFYR